METPLSVWLDVAQAKVETVTGTAAAKRPGTPGTSEVFMEPGREGRGLGLGLGRVQGRVQGPWDFWSELVARLAAGVDGGPLCVSPVTRPEPGIRTGRPGPDIACPDGTNVSTAPAREANVSPVETGEAAGKPRTKPGAPEGRQRAPESQPDNACPAWLPEKAKPSKTEPLKAKPSLQAAPECLVQEVRATGLVARSCAVAMPEAEDGAFAVGDVVSTRAHLAAWRMPARAVAAAVPVFGAGHWGPRRLESDKSGGTMSEKAQVRRAADGSLETRAARASSVRADSIGGAAADNPRDRVEMADRGAPPPPARTTLPQAGKTGAAPDARVDVSPKPAAPGWLAERPASSVFRETEPSTRGWVKDSILHPSGAAGLEDGCAPVVSVDGSGGRTDAAARPRPGDAGMPGTRTEQPDGPVLGTSSGVLLEAHSVDAGRSQDVRVMPMLTLTQGEAGSSLAGTATRTRDGVVEREPKAQAGVGVNDRVGRTELESARGEAAAKPAPADRRTGEETGSSAGRADGTMSAPPADRGGATDRVAVRESPVGASPSTGTGPEGNLRRSRVVGVQFEIVPRNEGSTQSTRAEQQGRGEVTSVFSRDSKPAFVPGPPGRSAPGAGETDAAPPARVEVVPKAAAPGWPAERPASTVFRETEPPTRGWMRDSILHSSGAAGLKDGGTPAVSVDDRTDATGGPRLEDAVMPGTRMEEPDRPVLGTSSPVSLEAHSVDAGRSQDVRVIPTLINTQDDAGSSRVGTAMQAEDALLDGEAKAQAGSNDRAGRTKVAAGPDGPVKAASHKAPEEPGAKVWPMARPAEVAPQPGAQTQATGEAVAMESLRNLEAGVGRHTAAVRKRDGRAPTVDTDALPHEPAVEHAAGVSGNKAEGVEGPAHSHPARSPRWSREEPTGVTARREAGREDAELAPARPAPAAASMPDSQEVRADRPPASDAGAAQQRQAPITARTVIDQIVQRAQLRLGRSEAEMVIDLKPDVLGRVHLRITAEPGRIVAEIRAESAVTRQFIEAGLADLRAALADRGLDLGAITVSGGFGAGVAWNGAKSRWSDDDAGHGPRRAAPGGGGPSAVRQVDPFVAARSSPRGVHLVDCVA